MNAPSRMVVRTLSRPPTEEVAAEWLWAWLEPLGQLGGLFGCSSRADRFEEVTHRSLERLLARSALGRLPDDSWTHELLLRWKPGLGRPAGTCLFRIGEAQRDGLGGQLSIDVEAATSHELTPGFEAGVRAGFTDEACLGPAGLALDDRINVLTFTKQFQTGELPSGARATAMGGGVCIRACALSAPEAEMRQAVLDVAKALAAVASASPSPKAIEAGPEPAVAPLAVAAPALVPQPPPAPSFDPDETLPMIATFVVPPAVPFSGTTSPAAAAAMFDPVEPRARTEEVNPDETAFLPVAAVVAPKTGTFRDQLGPLAVPLLSLSEYAELRARLTVFGEGHEPTLKRFGVAAREVREALRARFADYFQRDAAAQAQFLTGMQEAIVQVRKERDGGTE